MNFDLIGGSEVVDHIASGLLIAVIEDVVFWIHVPPNLVHFVSPVRPVSRHHDGSLEFSVNIRLLVASQAILNQSLAVLDGQELGNIIYD